MKVVSSNEHILDTAAGPVSVTVSQVESYDIDDYVHTAVRSLAQTIRLYNAAKSADTRLSENRDPVSIGDVQVGGF